MEIRRTYPYPSYGGAGPVAGGLQGHSGRVADPNLIRYDQGGKGVKAVAISNSKA